MEKEKAKEIIENFCYFKEKKARSYPNGNTDLGAFEAWLTTPEAAALLSGEDWISVKDRLPDIGDEYLVVYDLEDGDEPLTTAMQFDAIKNKWYDERAAGTECKTVLFWMPLPEPPKP